VGENVHKNDGNVFFVEGTVSAGPGRDSQKPGFGIESGIKAALSDSWDLSTRLKARFGNGTFLCFTDLSVQCKDIMGSAALKPEYELQVGCGFRTDV
jgi:hypothetical protein